MNLGQDVLNYIKSKGEGSKTEAVAVDLIRGELKDTIENAKICLSNGDIDGAKAILGVEEVLPSSEEPVAVEPEAPAEPEAVEPEVDELALLEEQIVNNEKLSAVEKAELRLKIAKIKEAK